MFLVIADRPGDYRATYVHDTFESAHEEAERLARANPTSRGFYVFEARGKAKAEPIPVQWTECRPYTDDIPF